MNLLRQVRLRRRKLVRALQISYATHATWLPQVFPDFMCIGAARAATTWLHKKLRSNTRVFLPKAKELHFFDEPPPFDHDDNWGLRKHRSFKFYFDMENPAHWRWYSLQFRNSKGRTKGEITPSYATLSPGRVRLITTVMPELQVIYLIRNPIDRAWSALRQTVLYQRGANHDILQDRRWLLRAALSPVLLDAGNYRRAIETWGGMMAEGKMLYLFYDDIDENPRSVLAEVHSFLRLEGSPVSEPIGHEQRTNAAPALDMPKEVRARLAEYYEEQIRFLEERFQRDLGSWRAA